MKDREVLAKGLTAMIKGKIGIITYNFGSELAIDHVNSGFDANNAARRMIGYALQQFVIEWNENSVPADVPHELRGVVNMVTGWLPLDMMDALRSLDKTLFNETIIGLYETAMS